MCAAYQEQIQATLSAFDQTTEAIKEAETEGVADEESADGVIGFLQDRIQDVQKAASGLVEGVGELAKFLKQMTSNLIDGLALMLVTSCIIPILVLILFLWLVRVITGFAFPMPTGMFRPRIGTLGKAKGGK